MRKHLFYLWSLLFACSFHMQAQTEQFYTKNKVEGDYTSLSFSGFRVEVIPSDTFGIVFNNDGCLKQQTVRDNKLSFLILDQTGRVPKETVQVYTGGQVKAFSIHNGELVMDQYLLTDSLKVNFAVARGRLKVHAEKLYITAGGGIDCEVQGTAGYFYGHQGGGSTIHHNQLECDHKDVKTTRYF
ncbi:MAG: hypothetical protein LUG98_03770 [Tannerellaceae bacterium]|nr:hypothetical protein [Tannerellaceae bacterium]